MTIINLYTSDQELFTSQRPKLASGNQKAVKIAVDFDSAWDGYARSGVFYTEKNSAVFESVMVADECTIPQEVLTDAGFLFIGVRGVKADGTVKTSLMVRYRIGKGADGKFVYEPTPGVYNQLLSAVGALDAKFNNIAKLTNGSTTGDAELVGIRLGADNVEYSTAGDAVRKQLTEKAAIKDLAPLEYEVGNIDINNSGWNYNSQYFQTQRVRIKEGREVHLVAGDIIGLTDYTNARFYVGYRTTDGVYSYAGWLTSDFVCPAEGDYIMLVANTTDAVQADVTNLGYRMFMQRVDGAVNQAAHQAVNISAAVDVDLGFILGSANATGVIPYDSRFITKDILCLDIDIVLSKSPNNRMAVFTYTDKDGSNYKDLGWQTDNGDYIIKAGTFFRILVMAEDYETQATLFIDPMHQYESGLYNSIEIFPVIGKKINLAKTARTLARIAASDAVKVGSKRIPMPPKMRSINHRGLNQKAPENTLPAYKLSKTYGFDFVECDVRWTSDNVPVLIHDESINRTARNADGTEISGVVNIADITYAEASTYDFGAYKSKDFAGTKIPTFEEFIALCRNIQLHPYVEIYGVITAEQAEILMGIVRKYGMTECVTWISFTHDSLLRIIENNRRSRVGYNVMASQTAVDNIMKLTARLRTDANEAFLNLASTSPLIVEYADKAFEMGIPMEVWCPNTVDEILALPVYVSGVTSDVVIASQAIYNANIV